MKCQSLKVFCLLVVAIFCSSCALPAGLGSHQDFVPELEISAVNLVREGGSLIEQGRGVDGEIKLWRAYSLVPDAPNVLGYIVRAREVSNRFDLALELLDQLIAKDSDNIDLLAQRARILFKMGDCAAARKIYIQLLNTAQSAIENVANGVVAPVSKNSVNAKDTKKVDYLDLKQTLLGDLATLEFSCGNSQKAMCYLEDSFYLKPSMPHLEQLVQELIKYGQLDRVESIVASTVNTVGAASAVLNLERAYAALGQHNQQLAVQFFENVRTRDIDASFRPKLDLLELLLRLDMAKTEQGQDLDSDQLDKLHDLVEVIQSSPELSIQYPVQIWDYLADVPALEDLRAGSN